MASLSSQMFPKIILDIQDCVSALKNDYKEVCQPINDDNALLHKFCMRLECLLIYDLKEKVSLLGVKKSFWEYFEKCLSSRKSTHDGIRFVKRLSEIHSSEGKGRAFVRFCLMHLCLADSFQRCIMNEKLTRDWYGDKSPFLHKDQSSFLLTALYDLNECEFDLSSHDRDLDVGWPKYSRKTGGSHFTWKPPSRSVSISSLASSVSLHDSLHPSESSMSTTVPSISDSMEVAQISSDEQILLRNEFQEKEKEVKSLTDQHEQLQMNYNQLQEKFDQREAYLHEQIEKLKTELCASQNTIDQLSVVDEKHEKSICEQSEFQKSVCSLSDDLKGLHAETKELSHHLRDLKSTQFEQVSQPVVQKLEERVLSIYDSVNSISDSIPDNVSTLSDENNNLKQQVSFLQSDNLELNKKIVTMRSEYSIYKAYPQLQEQVNALKDALTTSKKLISLKEMKITKLQSDLLKHKPSGTASKQLVSEASAAQLNAIFPPPADKNTDKYLLYEQVQLLFSQLESTEREKAMLVNIVKVAAGIQKNLEDKLSEKDEQLLATEKQMKDMNGKMVKMLALVDEQQKQFMAVRKNLLASQQENKQLTKQMALLNELLQQADKSDAELPVDTESSEVTTCATASSSHSSNDGRSDVSEKCISEDDAKSAVTVSVEKSGEPQIVVKVNRTLSKLHSLIEEKIELQQELETTKEMTCNLRDKVADQEHRLSTVTMELTQSQELISKMKSALSSLQTNESIMRYELKEKRHFLNKLKAQLESSRAQWKRVCKTNAESEVEWQNLREEFAQRHKQGSEESGFSDEGTKVEAVATDAVLHDKMAETSPTETDLSEIVSPDDSSPLIEGFPPDDDELDPRDRRLKFLEEQCRLLCRKLLNNSKYGAALDMRLTSLLGHHGSLDMEDTTAAAGHQETSETSETEMSNEATSPDEFGEVQPAPRDDDVKNDDDTNSESLKISIPEVVDVRSDDAVSPDDSSKKPTAFDMAHALPKRVEKLRKDKEDLQQELDKISTALQLAEAREVHLNAKIQLYQVEKDDTQKKLELAQQQISDLAVADKTVAEENHAAKRYDEVMTTKVALESKLDSIEERLQTKSNAMVDMELKLVRSQQELAQTKQTFEQELASLKFQMNTQSLKHQSTVKEHEEQQADLISTKNRLSGQEKTIFYLEAELNNVKDSYEKEKIVLWTQLDDVKALLTKKNEENQTLSEQFKDRLNELSHEKELVKQLQIELNSRTECHETNQRRMQQQIQQLQSDNDELRKRITQLLKDKDVLWKCSTHLDHLKASPIKSPKTPDDKILQCTKCNCEFGLLVRKHHCRICGKIFCYYCCNNWVPSEDSEKIRVCDFCCHTTTTEHEQAAVINSYINSVYEKNVEDIQDDIHFETTSQTISQSSSCSLLEIPADMADAEEHFISGDVLTQHGESEKLIETAWNDLTVLAVEDCNDLQTVSLTIKPGQKYGVVLLIHDTLKNIVWHFKSRAKNIGFSMLFCKSLEEKLDTTEIISPTILCNAHLSPVDGKLQPKKSGIYVLVFDNTHSRFTTKTVDVSFMLENIELMADQTAGQ